MKVIIIDKIVVESLNEINSSNHFINIVELADGRFCTPYKVIGKNIFLKYQKYLEECEVITISDNDIKKPSIK